MCSFPHVFFAFILFNPGHRSAGSRVRRMQGRLRGRAQGQGAALPALLPRALVSIFFVVVLLVVFFFCRTEPNEIFAGTHQLEA